MNIVEETLAMYWNQHRGLPYKEVLEYIETDGTQYWDTGHVRANTGEVEIDFMVLSMDNFPRVYGDRTDTNRQFAIGRSSVDGHILTYWDKRYDVPPAGYGFDPLNNRVFVRFGHGYVYEKSGSEEYTYQLPSATFTSSGTAKIGGYMYNDSISGMIGRIYVCREYNGTGELTHDYIPVLDWNNDACLYDRVTGRMLYHKNTTGTAKPTYQRWDKIDLEYLESTGTQYIDTGVIGTQNTSCILGIKATQINTKIFGARTGTSENNISVFYGTAGDPRLGIDFNNSNYATYRCQYDALNQKVTVTLSKVSRNIKNTEGTVLVSNDIICPDVIQTPTTLRLFDVANGFQANCFIGNVYSCKISASNILIRDFIPTQDRNGVNCMYDACYNKMYYNAGTGDFKGKVKLPDGYEAVEYLANDAINMQHIDSGVYLDNTTGYLLNFQLVDFPTSNGSTTIPFGSRSSSGDTRNWINFSTSGFSYGWNSYIIPSPVMPPSLYGERHIASVNLYNSRNCNIDNNYKADLSNKSTISQTYTAFIMACNNMGNAYYVRYPIRVWSCRITRGDEAIRNFIPCVRKSDGKPGMYDLCHSICQLTGTSFYVNAGTGEFTVPSQSQP